MSASKIHNKLLSSPKSASADSPGAKSRQPIGTAQEAVDPSPGPHPAPDARGPAPRKNPRGPASPDALLQASDACGNLPQKITRTPVPVRQERSRRGRPYPQNRDGSGNAGLAEGSLPRLAPEGQDIEQEIALLRSLANRLLSRRPLNHTYISRYMRLLIQAQSAQSRTPKELTDEQEVDSLIKKLFYKRVEDGQLSFFDLLPIRTAKPGEKWWPWRQLMSVEERRRDGLIGPEDQWPSDVDEYLDEKAAHEAEMAAFEAETWRDMEAVLDGMFASDPVLSNLYDPDEESPDPDDDDYDPDDPDPSPPDPDYEDPDDDELPPGLTVTSDPPPELPIIPPPEPESIPAPLPIPMPREESDTSTPGPTPSLPTHTLPSVVPAEGRACPCEGRGTHPPTPNQAGLDPPPCPPLDLPDVDPLPNPKPRIARGRPPP